jgi:transcriptional antiterminator RfaH
MGLESWEDDRPKSHQVTRGSEDGSTGMAENWYVLRSKPRRESALFRYAHSHGHEIFYPSIPVNPVNPRASKIRPYFPGYMFLRTDLSVVGRSTFQWMPFSHGLVHIGGEPARVPDPIVGAIRERIGEIWEQGGLSYEKFKRGDWVMIRSGAFEGYRGILDDTLPGSKRVRILLKMLSDRFVPMEMDVDLLETVDGQN